MAFPASLSPAHQAAPSGTEQIGELLWNSDNLSMVQRAEGSFPRSHNSTLAGLLQPGPRPAAPPFSLGRNILFIFLPPASKRGLIAKTIGNVCNKMKTIRNSYCFFCQEAALGRNQL